MESVCQYISIFSVKRILSCPREGYHGYFFARKGTLEGENAILRAKDFRIPAGNDGVFLAIYYSSRYYLRDSNGSVSFANVSNTTRDWLLQELNGQTASLTNSQIEVIDPVTAAVTPMREQLRNQHIVVEINAYYNDTSDTFNFRVLPWNEKEEEVEFN